MAEAAVENPMDGGDVDLSAQSDVDLPAGDQATTDTAEGDVGPIDGTEEVSTDAPAGFPEDWAAQLAGDDEAGLSILSRYTSPQKMAEAFLGLRKQMSAGQLRRQLAADASDEEVQAWREENGIPLKPEGYDLDLDGRVLPEGDESIVESFIKDVAHATNLNPAQASEAIRWYADLAEQEASQQIEADRAFKQAGVDELRMAWQSDYRPKINAIGNLLGEELSEKLLTARGLDGNILGNDPQIMQWLAQTARDLNPVGTLTGLDAPTVESMQARKDVIETAMKSQGSEYWKGPKDANGNTRMQQEYLQIIEAEQKLARRG